ncbi:MAG: isochorismatase family protein [Candidatus Nanoarchaeia archaeon]
MNYLTRGLAYMTVAAALALNVPAAQGQSKNAKEASPLEISINTKDNCSNEKNNEGKTALLLVDMQDYFLNALSSEELKTEMPNYIKLIKKAIKNKAHIFVLEYKGRNTGKTNSKLMKFVSKGDYTLVQKSWSDGFYNTNLDDLLKQKGINKLVLAGVNASCCVLGTGESAVKKGYTISTSPDVIGDDKDYKPEETTESLKWYSEKGRLCNNYRELAAEFKN